MRTRTLATGLAAAAALAVAAPAQAQETVTAPAQGAGTFTTTYVGGTGDVLVAPCGNSVAFGGACMGVPWFTTSVGVEINDEVTENTSGVVIFRDDYGTPMPVESDGDGSPESAEFCGARTFAIPSGAAHISVHVDEAGALTTDGCENPQPGTAGTVTLAFTESSTS